MNLIVLPSAQKIVPSNKSVSQQRNKYTLRLMGKASSGRNPTSTSEDKPVQREVFIAPETSIIDYFMVKVSWCVVVVMIVMLLALILLFCDLILVIVSLHITQGSCKEY